VLEKALRNQELILSEEKEKNRKALEKYLQAKNTLSGLMATIES